MLLLNIRVAAYIDPSAMTYIIQIIAGVVIAAGAAFGFYLRRIKRAFSKLGKKDDGYDGGDFDDDDDDDTGMGDYELPKEATANVSACADANAVKETPAPAVNAAPAEASANVSAYADANASAAAFDDEDVGDPFSEEELDALGIDFEEGFEDIPERKPDRFDETGGEGGLMAENRELRRLLAVERRRVEILKQALHVCTGERGR